MVSSCMPEPCRCLEPPGMIGKVVTRNRYATMSYIVGLFFAGATLSVSSVVVRCIRLQLYRTADSESRPLLSEEAKRSNYGSRRGRGSGNTHANRVPFGPDHKSLTGWIWFTRAICLVLSLGSAIVAGSFPYHTAPSTALSASHPCGVYSLSLNASDSELIADDAGIQAGKESRAGQYARDCYDRPQSPQAGRCTFYAQTIDPDRCNFFNNQSLPYNTKTNQDCPFANPDICAQPHMAVEFSTGLLGGNLLGITSPRLPFQYFSAGPSAHHSQ